MAPSTAAPEMMSRAAPIPRGEKRRREIVAVAARVFLANGFADSTMQAIAAEAGASKETLYRHFGSKEGLFAEVIDHRSEHFIAQLDENFQRPHAVEETLRAVGRRLLEKMTAPDGLSLCRTVIAEGPRNPGLGRIFFDQGPERLRKRLTRYLTAAVESGELDCQDPALAAKIFLGAILTYHHMSQLVLPDTPLVTEAEMRRHVDEVIAMFLMRYMVGGWPAEGPAQ